ncbi:MAG: zinc ribbon domain-containing protein [Clostridia bacterium]|nr:zinc ribbon domain-containing protein [Clostridia bacterium]
MNCKYCGTSNPNSAKFCSKCGRPVTPKPPPRPEPEFEIVRCPMCRSSNVHAVKLSRYQYHTGRSCMYLKRSDNDVVFWECKDCSDITIDLPDLNGKIVSTLIGMIIGVVMRCILFLLMLLVAIGVMFMLEFLNIHTIYPSLFIDPLYIVLLIFLELISFFATLPFIEKEFFSLYKLMKEKKFIKNCFDE